MAWEDVPCECLSPCLDLLSRVVEWTKELKGKYESVQDKKYVAPAKNKAHLNMRANADQSRSLFGVLPAAMMSGLGILLY